MVYNLDGKSITISDAELAKLQKSLGITKEEAIETWLADNDFIEDEIEAELTAKAKQNRITATVHKASTDAKKERKPRVKKENLTKKEIISLIFSVISAKYSDAVVTNDEKYIDFTIDNRHFTLNLVEHRQKKQK